MSRKIGVSVSRHGPYWHVVERPDGRYVVVDTSPEDGVPVQVFGPTTRKEARQWARSEAMLFMALRGGGLELEEWG